MDDVTSGRHDDTVSGVYLSTYSVILQLTGRYYWSRVNWDGTNPSVNVSI